MRFIFRCISFYLFPLFAIAADVEPVLDELVITTARPEFKDADAVDGELHSGFRQVLTRADWQQDSTNLGDLLSSKSSVQIRKSGGFGGFSLVSLRGSLSDQVAIYLDGFLLNDASGGGVNLNTVTLSEIDSIEIYRGVAPIQGGIAPIGGAVYLKSRHANIKRRSEITIGAGNQNSYHAAAALNGSVARSPWSLSFDYLHSNNDFKYLNNNGTVWNLNDDRVESRANNGFNRYSVLSNFAAPLSGNSKLDVIYRFQQAEQSLPSWNNRPINTRFDSGTHHTQLKWNRLSPIAGFDKTSVSVDYQVQNELYDDRENEVGLGRQWERGLTTASTIKWYGETLLGNSLLHVNANWSYEIYNSSDQLRQVRLYQYQRNAFGVSGALSQFYFGEKLLFKPAIVAQGSVVNEGVVVPAGTMLSSTYVSPSFGWIFHWTPGLQVNANIARALREPALYELYGDRGLFLGNPELVPERSANADFGLTWNSMLVQPAVSTTSTIAVFSNRIENGISKVYSAQGIGRAMNVAKAQVTGFEISLEATHVRFGGLRYDMTRLTTENLTENTSYYKKQLPGRFTTTHALRYQQKIASSSGYVQLQSQSGLFYDTMNLLPAKDRFTVDTGFSTITGYGEISMRIENVTNAQYSDFNGYPYADRLYFVSYKNAF